MRQEPAVGKKSYKTFTPQLRNIDEKNRTIEFVASTEAVDRYGDIIRTSGWKLDAYRKNPVFLWAHKSSEPPIGKTTEVRIETSPVPALVQRVQFADKETYPFADVIYNLYRGGYLKAVSVGFLVTEEPKAIRDESNDMRTGWEFNGQELLELSAVPVPANPEAVARIISKGFGSEADLERVFSAPPAVSTEAAYRELIAAYQELSSIATATAREALAMLKAASLSRAEHGEVAVEELTEAVRLAGSAVQDVPEAAEISTLEQLAQAVGSDDVQLSDDETFSDSRFWRTGKLTIRRELR